MGKSGWIGIFHFSINSSKFRKNKMNFVENSRFRKLIVGQNVQNSINYIIKSKLSFPPFSGNVFLPDKPVFFLILYLLRILESKNKSNFCDIVLTKSESSHKPLEKVPLLIPFSYTFHPSGRCIVVKILT